MEKTWSEKQALEEKWDKCFAPVLEERRQEVAGAPFGDFWARALENFEIISENITQRDSIALRYLTDIRCITVMSDSDSQTQSSDVGDFPPPEGFSRNTEWPVGSFTLVFTFKENPYFTNRYLTKTYRMDPDDFEEFDHAEGCKIDWKPGKSLTVKVFRKTKNGRVKEQPADSFFNFFAPPEADATAESIASSLLEEYEALVDADYELGETIRNDVIPKALF